MTKHMQLWLTIWFELIINFTKAKWKVLPLKGAICHQKDEYLLRLAHQCGKKGHFFQISAFWQEKKVERIFYAKTIENLQQCFPAATRT